MKLVDKEDTIETFGQYCYVDGEAKWVLIDEKGNVLDKNPCEGELYDKYQRRSNLDLLPIDPFPGMEYDDEKNLFVLKGFVWLIEKEYNSFTMLVHDYKNPVFFDPDGSFEDDGTQIFIKVENGDINLDDLCPMMEIVVYGIPNMEESFITQDSLYGRRNEDNDYLFDGLLVETKEQKVTIRGKDGERYREKEDIPIDACIAKEVEDLNNVHNVKTVMSCCGHKEEKGFITTTDNDIYKDKMTSLGYQYVDNGAGYFIPLSSCKCTCKNMNTDVLIMRKLYHNDYWKQYEK